MWDSALITLFAKPLGLLVLAKADALKKKKSTLEWCGERPSGDRKGGIPRFSNLALGGASWHWCF